MQEQTPTLAAGARRWFPSNSRLVHKNQPAIIDLC